MPGNRFTFPEGRDEDVAEEVFWRGYVVLVVEEVPENRGKMVHFGRMRKEDVAGKERRRGRERRRKEKGKEEN